MMGLCMHILLPIAGTLNLTVRVREINKILKESNLLAGRRISEIREFLLAMLLPARCCPAPLAYFGIYMRGRLVYHRPR